MVDQKKILFHDYHDYFSRPSLQDIRRKEGADGGPQQHSKISGIAHVRVQKSSFILSGIPKRVVLLKTFARNKIFQ